MTDCNADSVGIGIGSDNEIGFLSARQIEGHFQGARFLGVGEFDGGKVPIWFALFGHDAQRKAEFGAYALNHEGTGSVEGGVDDLDALCAILGSSRTFGKEFAPDNLPLDHPDKIIIHPAINILDHALIQRLFQLHGVDFALHGPHFADNAPHPGDR